MRSALLTLLFLLSFNSFAFDLSMSAKLGDFNQLVNMLKSSYGPLEYKKATQGIDIDMLRVKYTEQILMTDSNRDFYYTLVKFVSEFRDSHFVLSVPTDHRAFLGFITDLVDGKVLIETVREWVPVKNLEKGDEILEFNGVSVSKVLTNLKQYISSGREQTRVRMAAMYLTYRNGVQLPIPTENSATLKIRKRVSGDIFTVSVPWKKWGSYFDEYPDFEFEKSNSLRTKTNFDELSMVERYKKINGPLIELTYMCSGETRVAIPSDATIIRRTPFVAYYHPTAKGNVGYLRIPHYYPRNEQTGEDETKLRFEQYKQALSVLEEKTVGLVIDQDHNCGGSVSYLEDIVGLFMDRPFVPTLFEVLANKETYMDYANWLAQVPTSDREYTPFKNLVEKIKASWKRGDFLTEKMSFTTFDTVDPNRDVNYSKPILILIDELAVSGGDAFPSLMQGLGRATLFGQTTQGGGGNVTEMPALFHSQMISNLTRSLFYRPDGVAVENNGAVPNVFYKMTEDDFVNNYKGYQKAYLQTLLDMI